ncbi:NUDIX domain-containing protein [Shouchella sp. JSM 1781072]|uniref:NUDIX hydrolase n=1 Tax=Shouchella sp. JSM 1781072 TaxID=3344581 RepID=UPI0035C16988
MVEKVYAYVTRDQDGVKQVLVFRHSNPEAGVQVPKGTVERNEKLDDAIKREVTEETGLRHFKSVKRIAEDEWENEDGHVQRRIFYHVHVDQPLRDEWSYAPTGGGAEDQVCFHYYWIDPYDSNDLIRGHGDYLHDL